MNSITLATARRLAIRAQGLDGGWPLDDGVEGAAQVIERLGRVQIDSIHVVQRAHHHALWTRHRDYAPPMLHELQTTQRRVFEGWWGSGISVLPIGDYRYTLPRMREFAASAYMQRFRAEHEPLLGEILARIRVEGPLGAADFEAPEGFVRGTWWNWKPAKRALEVLFTLGELMVQQRRNFQRIFDLPERVLPPGVDTTEPTLAEAARFMMRRFLAAHGLVALEEIRRGHGSLPLAAALRELVEAGEAVPVAVEGLTSPTYYAQPQALAEAATTEANPRVRLLSPFDGLVIERRRLQRLFAFDYTIECYLPAPKRQWGYFCLPILWGDRLVGRLDPKAERQSQTFWVRHLALEPGVEASEAFAAALAQSWARSPRSTAAPAWSSSAAPRRERCRPCRTNIPERTACGTMGVEVSYESA